MKMFIYRCLLPIISLKAVYINVGNIFRYPRYIYEFIKYKNQSKNEIVDVLDMYPCLSDKTSISQSGKGHYFYQDIWALGKIFKGQPLKHIDIGSRIDGFAGQCSSFCEVEFVDLRPVDLGLNNFKMIEGNILQLPFKTSTVASLSSLHVIEHIGLGRYGDDVDFEGSKKAMAELQRVLKVNGDFYLGVPIGRERVMYNAHRVHSPKTILAHFQKCKLIEFSVIDDNGEFIQNANIDNYTSSTYACGLFHFRKELE